jgi:cytochrome c
MKAVRAWAGLAGVSLIVASACARPEARASRDTGAAAKSPPSGGDVRGDRFAHLPPRFGLGRPATAEEVAAWDIDVMPDGTGLPEGRGTVEEGRALYASQCMQCHGAKGEGGEAEALVGREPRRGFPFGRKPGLMQTVGNYWPYATTLYDYINRAMPSAVPGSLEPDEVYSLVAFILFLNEIVPEDAVMDRRMLPRVVMPARDRFVRDDRRGGAEIR